jgi:hypothetical protein
VLGAGASHPYRFPLGSELVDQLCSDITPDSSNHVLKRLSLIGHNPGSVNPFVKALREARPFSVDAFLETRREFRDVGKAAIAENLLRKESESVLDAAPPEQDWYRYILNSFFLKKGPDHFKSQAHQLTIITFNFDRSFERVLFGRLKAQFGLTNDEARILATELHIHHVHGMLGQPSWLYPGVQNATNYGDDEREAVQAAAAGIKIVDDDIDQEQLAVLEDAQVALAKADFVYFIGFGFDERNLSKLCIPESINPAANVRATAFHLTGLETRPILRWFQKGPEPKIHLDNMDALTFVRN